jgi:hypothetical protein
VAVDDHFERRDIDPGRGLHRDVGLIVEPAPVVVSPGPAVPSFAVT